MKVVAKHHSIRYNEKSPSLLKGYDAMTLSSKVSFWLKACCLLVLLFAFLRGKPPSYAQTMIPVTPVISNEDAVQDEKINDLRTYEVNQENWNHETGQVISAIKDSMSTMQGEERGIFVLLGMLHGLGMFFQVRGQRTKP